MRPAVSLMHRINDHSGVYRFRDSDTITQLGQTGNLQNYAHNACDEGLECLGVFIPTVPRTVSFRLSRGQRLPTRSTSI